VSGKVSRSACTVALATATVLALVPFAPPAGADPGDPAPAAGTAAGTATARTTVAGLLTDLHRLYRQAEEATEAYNATEVALTRQRTETERLGREVVRARTALVRSRADAGRLARAQYEGRSELSGYLRLLLAPDPQQALDEGHLLRRAARGRAATIARLTTGEKHADALATASRKALDTQQVLAANKKKLRDTVTGRLRKVEKLLASLSSEQIAELDARERNDTDKAQQKLIASGALGVSRPSGSARPASSARSSGSAGASGGQALRALLPSAAGAEALEYAVAQIGKPYRWGAEGPESFDCSGLTSQAWARAGLTVPRTSQDQWRVLSKVALDRLRPGDLVVYFAKATHVAIYLGDGMVIQAPRPGSRVKVSPLAANPLLGAVRPDPAAASLVSYAPPVLPPGTTNATNRSDSTDSSDRGYDAETAP
jgi:cell wall-associated NlpC family hydrolase